MKNMFKGSTVALFVALVAAFGGGNAFGEDLSSPFSGGKTYKKHCGMCHGEKDRRAIPGAHDFFRGGYLMMTDGQIFKITREGKKTMPAFIGILSDRQIEKVVNYIRTIK